ncbi:hypothetical protein FACS1894161_5150 [Spirochaetia bacterium]|nr:hypothetical protein FACS1894161_5150 [Spirochaetia bacterium]
MAHVLIMPRQGNTVESCIIQEWKVKEGETVKADTAVCVVETDKATFEVPAGADGQVLKILHEGGDDVPVLAPIAVIGAAGEDYSSVLGEGGNMPPEGITVSDAVSGGHAVLPEQAGTRSPVSVPSGAPPRSELVSGTISPRARNLAVREGIPSANIAGTGPGGRIIERDVAAVLAARPPLTAAALAAAASGAALPGAGTGLGGRITAGDLATAGSGGGGTVPGTVPVSIAGEGAITETPVKGIRKLIADRMLASLEESAQFTLNASAPATRLQELRKRMKASGEANPELGVGKVTVNDLVLYAVSRMLPNASEILLGAIPLEALDLTVNPRLGEVVGAHGDQPLHRLY